MLLGSPPDMVHGVRLRKTHSSTQKNTHRTASIRSSEKGSTPAYSGFQVQGPATPPVGMALFYGLPYYYTKHLISLQEKIALFQKKAFFPQITCNTKPKMLQ